MATGKYYLIELRDGDGNDCSVEDLLFGPCQDSGEAYDMADTYIKSEWPNDEDDGSGGTFHPCDCECEHGASPWDDDAKGHEDGRCGDQGWECSHGGVLLGEPEEYATHEDAMAGHAPYRGLVDLTSDDDAVVV